MIGFFLPLHRSAMFRGTFPSILFLKNIPSKNDLFLLTKMFSFLGHKVNLHKQNLNNISQQRYLKKQRRYVLSLVSCPQSNNF